MSDMELRGGARGGEAAHNEASKPGLARCGGKARRGLLCAVRCARCAVRCALCAVRCALCAVRCALCSVRCALCAVRCALRAQMTVGRYTVLFAWVSPCIAGPGPE